MVCTLIKRCLIDLHIYILKGPNLSAILSVPSPRWWHGKCQSEAAHWWEKLGDYSANCSWYFREGTPSKSPQNFKGNSLTQISITLAICLMKGVIFYTSLSQVSCGAQGVRTADTGQEKRHSTAGSLPQARGWLGFYVCLCVCVCVCVCLSFCLHIGIHEL